MLSIVDGFNSVAGIKIAGNLLSPFFTLTNVGMYFIDTCKLKTSKVLLQLITSVLRFGRTRSILLIGCVLSCIIKSSELKHLLNLSVIKFPRLLLVGMDYKIPFLTSI